MDLVLTKRKEWTWVIDLNVFFICVHFRLAEEYGMKLVYKKSFADYFAENVEKGEHRNLLNKMQSLEVSKIR